MVFRITSGESNGGDEVGGLSQDTVDTNPTITSNDTPRMEIRKLVRHTSQNEAAKENLQNARATWERPQHTSPFALEGEVAVALRVTSAGSIQTKKRCQDALDETKNRLKRDVKQAKRNQQKRDLFGRCNMKYLQRKAKPNASEHPAIRATTSREPRHQ